MVWDDGSKDPRIKKYLDQLAGEEKTLAWVVGKREDGPSDLAARIGLQRKMAVDFFLKNFEGDYLFLLDDDVLVPYSTIAEAIEDFEMLRRTSYGRIGSLTLFPVAGKGTEIIIAKKRFCFLPFSGEGHVLFHRETFESVGNHFGPHPNGFGDTQFAAQWKAGLRHYSRVEPLYEVQHLGFGPQGSVIHRTRPVLPRWAASPYTKQWRLRAVMATSDWVPVTGFDMDKYVEIVQTVGGRDAPLKYLSMEEANRKDLEPSG